ncbi:MAG TPA: hypothetical protein VFL13_10535 [Candidatus Baltobacteraceae bacterium]|nr:hypothetical protein [Candidatus Baltobacteraceae bacterium]
MTDAVFIVMLVAVAAIGVYGFRYYTAVSNDPESYITVDDDPDNAWGMIFSSQFRGQTPERARVIATQQAFQICFAIPILMIVLVVSMVKTHAH